MWVRGSSNTTFDPLRLLEVPKTPWIAAPVTFALVALATAVKVMITVYEPEALVFATFYPALAIATLMFGRVWGYVAVAMSVLISAYAFMEPYYHLGLGSKASFVNSMLYIVSGSTLVEICSAYRKALARIQKKRELLTQEHARTELLARELQHRTKNTAAVIASIVRQSLKGEPDAASRVLGRINAMYSADLLERTPKGLCNLDEVVAHELSSIDACRVTISGPPVQVSYDLARSIAMILHELFTNAAKYGALSTAQGHIVISWHNDETKVAMRWAETGGPALSGAAPTQRGFGSFLIERLLGEHGGTLVQSFSKQGFSCTMDFFTDRHRSEEAA